MAFVMPLNSLKNFTSVIFENGESEETYFFISSESRITKKKVNRKTANFKINEGNLVSTLAEKGISLSSVKILTSSESLTKNFDNNFMNSEKSFSQQNQGSFDQNRRQDSNRRATLWQEYQDRLGA